MSQELSVQKFIDAGYREYPVSDTSKALHKYADRFLQKRVKENSSTLYFINVYYYVQTYDMDLASIEVVFHSSDVNSFTVISGVIKPISEMESWLRSIYDNMNCIPKDKND